MALIIQFMGKKKAFPIPEKSTQGSQKYFYEALVPAQIAHHKEKMHQGLD